ANNTAASNARKRFIVSAMIPPPRQIVQPDGSPRPITVSYRSRSLKSDALTGAASAKGWTAGSQPAPGTLSGPAWADYHAAIGIAAWVRSPPFFHKMGELL